MALWDKSQRLQGPLLEQMKQLYGPRFPIEVRHYLATWIEAQLWYECNITTGAISLFVHRSDIDPDNPGHEPNARRLFEAMLIALQEVTDSFLCSVFKNLPLVNSHLFQQFHHKDTIGGTVCSYEGSNVDIK